MAGERPVALAANVAADAGVDLHVLLQSRLGLEALPTEQAEDGHVRACGAKTPALLVRGSKSHCLHHAESSLAGSG